MKIKAISLKIIHAKKEFEEKNQWIKYENNEISSNFLNLKKKMFLFWNCENKWLNFMVNETINSTN